MQADFILKIHYQLEKLGLLIAKPLLALMNSYAGKLSKVASQKKRLLSRPQWAAPLCVLAQTQTRAPAWDTHFMSHRDKRKQLQLPSSVPTASEEQDESPIKCRAAVTFSLLGHCVKQMWHQNSLRYENWSSCWAVWIQGGLLTM